MAPTNEVTKIKSTPIGVTAGATNSPALPPAAEQGMTFAQATEAARSAVGPNLKAVCPILPAPNAMSGEQKWKVVEYKQEDVVPLKVEKVRISDNRNVTAIEPEVPSAGRWLKIGNGPKSGVVYLPDLSGTETKEADSWLGRLEQKTGAFLSGLGQSLRSDIREIGYHWLGKIGNLFLSGPDHDPKNIVEISRAEKFKESSAEIGRVNGRIPANWAEVDKLADQRISLRRGDLERLEPGFNVVIVHDSLYDTPKNPKYQLTSWSKAWEAEKSQRRKGHFAFTDSQAVAEKEFGSVPAFLAKGVVEASTLSATPGGDVTIHKIYDYARSLADKDQYSPSVKRSLILGFTRGLIGDDQTLQSGIIGENKTRTVTIREAVIEKAGVCRHLAGILYGAFNAAGVKTELHCSNTHQWVESYDKGGTVVTIDPNGFYNYAEFPGSRGGAFADSEGKIVVPKSAKK